MLAKLSFSDLADFSQEKLAGISGVGASNEPSGSQNPTARIFLSSATLLKRSESRSHAWSSRSRLSNGWMALKTSLDLASTSLRDYCCTIPPVNGEIPNATTAATTRSKMP